MSCGVAYSWAVIIKAVLWTIGTLLALSGGLFFADSHWLLPLAISGVLGLLLVGYYVFRKVFMSNESDNEPADTPQLPVRPGSVAINIKGGSGIYIGDNRIHGYDTGIQAVDTKDLRTEGNDIS